MSLEKYLHGEDLLPVARDAITRQLGLAGFEFLKEDWMQQPGASFVTLTKRGDLRGCIGSLQANRPLIEDVQANAVAAALRDPRFPAVRKEELDTIRIEVSLLTEPEEFAVTDERDAVQKLRPGVDGIVLQFGSARGTFLPQVWESLPQPQDFMANLKRKAGLPQNFWHESVRLFRYEVRKWKEMANG